jgi:asparagine synthase (glutamine-hydrolysing)
MCGFVGIVRLGTGPVHAAELSAMAAVLNHRGPDEEGAFIDGGVGFHHKRLSIIDLATGRQPMTDGPLTIVFNGEIYNYVELRSRLETLGHAFRTTSDTEVLLKAYRQYGLRFVDELNGMFAILIWDARERRIVAVRDRIGIKPLYYHNGDGCILFASEIKALLRHPSVRAERNDTALFDYITLQFVLDEQTLFRDIRKLMPGHMHVIDVDTGRTRVLSYWEPKYDVDFSRRESDFVEELRALLEDAVRLQLRSDVPVGTYLSGGLDSSVVTTVAASLGTAPLDTFTGAFREGTEFDERRYARSVAMQCGATMHEIVPTEDDFVELMPRLAWAMDEPAAGPGLFPQYMVSRCASRHVKVVLGGQGGDEVFGGYARYVVAYLEQAMKGAIYETNEEGEHIVSLQSIVPHLPSLQAYAPMIRTFWRDGVFDTMERRYFRLLDRSEGNLAFLHPDLRHSYDRDGVYDRFLSVFHDPGTRSYLNKMVRFDLLTGLPALLHVEDRVSMACSLESRVPLLDHRIVELAGRIPPAIKFGGAELKHVFKRAVRDLLPTRIIVRKDKMGFPVPLHLWSRGRLRSFLHDLLTDGSARSRTLFDPGEVDRLLDSEAAFGRRLWGVLNLELWHRQFLDAPHGPDRVRIANAAEAGSERR